MEAAIRAEQQRRQALAQQNAEKMAQPVQQKAKGGQPSLDTMRLALNQQGMYSPLEKAAMSVPRTKGTPAEFMAEISKQPGFRKEEVEDRKISLPEQKMTKAEMLAHIQSHEAPKLQERVFGGNDYLKALDEAAQQIIGDPYASFDDLHGRDRDKARIQVESEWGYDPETKHEKWRLPGGENYREVLLKLPQRGLNEAQQRILMNYEADVRRGAQLDPWHQKQYDELLARKQAGNQDFYATHHWEDPNVLAHLRLSDRKGPNGEKILHVEEVQSDWHQQGRKEGYRGDIPNNARLQKTDDGYVYVLNQGEWLNDPKPTPEEAKAEALEGYSSTYSQNAVPDAPFKKNWHELALKHALGMAANGGYDGIAITPGDIQAERWDNPKLKVQYDTTIPSFLNKVGKPHGAQVGTIPVNTPANQEPASGEDIAEGLGMSWEDFSNHPNRAALEKQFWQQRKKQTTDLHYFPITDSLRQQINTEGLPQYERGGKVTGIDHFFQE